MPDWALWLLLAMTPLGFMWLSRRFYAPGGEGFRRASSPEHAAQLRSEATHLCAAMFFAAAIAPAPRPFGSFLIAPIVLLMLGRDLLLRRGRSRSRSDLQARVDAGEILAGAPANWLSLSRRTQWPGVLILTREHTVSWEPDQVAARRGFRVRSWPAQQVHFDPLKAGRALTGERCRRVNLKLPADQGDAIPRALSTKFVLFSPVGPFNEAFFLPA